MVTSLPFQDCLILATQTSYHGDWAVTRQDLLFLCITFHAHCFIVPKKQIKNTLPAAQCKATVETIRTSIEEKFII